ncbi:hypothetical protein AB0Q95_45530 [Streptomyces sp. NPDC059900]|uniref:hypothetical protein n=1 Tax=Streptomyces sp. NPDC059900 TaxID=3155816 RepID=UPI003412E61F
MSGTAVPSETAQERAIAAYLGMWQDVAEAGSASDWKSPQLAWHATGQALDAISGGMHTDHRNGLVSRGHPESPPSVSRADPAADPTRVVLSDCRDASRWLKHGQYRQQNGDHPAGSPRERQTITAEVTKQHSGEWKVTRLADEGAGSC